MILINRCAQAPRPRAPIPMRYLFFMNKAFIEYLGTISLCHMIVWCKSNIWSTLFPRFCALVLIWRCQLVMLRASLFPWGMLAPFGDSFVTRACKSARVNVQRQFTQLAMIGCGIRRKLATQHSNHRTKSLAQFQRSWTTTCSEWWRLKYVSSVDIT